MSIDTISCTRCGGSKFISFCKTCGDLQAHDEAIRREAGQAAYDHAAVFHRRLVAAQDALVAYPAIVTKLVRGYGIDVNEHQIESWLNDQLAAILGAEPANERNNHE